MAKELPYFKFFVSEWTDGDITLEDYETQGLFINICAYYWSNNCQVDLEKVKKKFRSADEKKFQILIDADIMKINKSGKVVINFLDEQYQERAKKSVQASENGKKGGLAKAKKYSSKRLANASDSLKQKSSKSVANKRRKEKRREDTPLPPSLDEVKEYFKLNGFSLNAAERAFNHYAGNSWNDANDNPVKNWKNKMQTVWFKDENKIKTNGVAEPKTNINPFLQLQKR